MKKGVTTAVTVLLMGSQAIAGYVTAECGLCVRSEPTEDSEVLEVLPIGTEVPDGGGWIEYENGYISSEWVGDENPLEYIGEWRITAYEYTGLACANGEFPEVGETVAHNSLPFGTKIYIEGVGVRTVEDRGPASMGSEWCDVYMGDVDKCITWGEQYKKVYLVEDE